MFLSMLQYIFMHAEIKYHGPKSIVSNTMDRKPSHPKIMCENHAQNHRWVRPTYHRVQNQNFPGRCPRPHKVGLQVPFKPPINYVTSFSLYLNNTKKCMFLQCIFVTAKHFLFAISLH